MIQLFVLSHFSYVQLFVTPWTVARRAPLSVGFSRQERWSGLPFPSPGDHPNPGIEPRVSCIILLSRSLPCFLFCFPHQHRHPHITWIKLFVFGDLEMNAAVSSDVFTQGCDLIFNYFFLKEFICFGLCWVFWAAHKLLSSWVAWGLLSACGVQTYRGGSSWCTTWGLDAPASVAFSSGTQFLQQSGLIPPCQGESSWTSDQTHVPCLGRRILNHWNAREGHDCALTVHMCCFYVMSVEFFLIIL